MKRRAELDLPMDGIAELCRKYAVTELAVFGSALRDDFGAESDIDFLVAFANNDCGPWLSKLTEMEEQLSKLLHRSVDLVHQRGIEQSRNWIRRKAIFGSAKVIYAS